MIGLFFKEYIVGFVENYLLILIKNEISVVV